MTIYDDARRPRGDVRHAALRHQGRARGRARRRARRGARGRPAARPRRYDPAVEDVLRDRFERALHRAVRQLPGHASPGCSSRRGGSPRGARDAPARRRGRRHVRRGVRDVGRADRRSPPTTPGWARRSGALADRLRDVGDRVQVRGGDRARARRRPRRPTGARASPRCCSRPTRRAWASGSSSASARPCSPARPPPASTASTPRTTVDVGGQLRFFGDGWQASKVLAGQRYWRIPVMEGEFLVQERFGIVEGRRRRQPHHPRRGRRDARCGAAEAAAEAMRPVEGAIMPFPGGIARSGSKVGSRYKALIASTNHVLCPTLRAQVDDSEVPDGVGSVFEIVIDGLGARAGARGDAASASTPRRGRARRSITAGNYGGSLGQHHFHLKELRAVTLTLTLREPPVAPVRAEGSRPDRLAGLSAPRSSGSSSGTATAARRSASCSPCPGAASDGRARRGRPAPRHGPGRGHGRRPPDDRGRRGPAHRRGDARRRAGRRGRRRRLGRARRCAAGGSSCAARPGAGSAAPTRERARHARRRDPRARRRGRGGGRRAAPRADRRRRPRRRGRRPERARGHDRRVRRASAPTRARACAARASSP